MELGLGSGLTLSRRIGGVVALRVNIFTPNTSPIEAGTVTFTGKVVGPDPITTLEYQVDGGAFTSFTVAENWSVDISIALANTSVTIRATDDQLETDTATFNFTAQDTTAPVVGGDGVLTTSNVTDSGFTIGFTKATDNAYAQSTLVYKLYTGSNEVVTDIDRIEDEGTLVDQGTDVAELSGAGFAGEQIEGAVLVEDPEGNKALYGTFNVLLLAPEINSITVLDGETEVTEIEGDADDSGSLGWQVDAFETTPAQEEVTVESSDINVVTVSNVDQVNKTFDYTLIGAGTATIILTSDFDANIITEVSVSVNEVTEMTEFESSVGFTAIDP